ncbi:hypothetical protein [Methylobacterium sp. JK268]
MTAYVISLPPELQRSAPHLVGAIEATGGVLLWENVWLIDREEHPSHTFQLAFSGGAFAFPATHEEFWISIGPRCSVEARKFLTDKVYRRRNLSSGSRSPEGKYRYIGGGERLFRPIIEKFEFRQQESGLTTPLCEIMARHGSDKALGWHNYTPFYSVLFGEISDPITSLFEVGLGTNFADMPSNMGPDGVPGASLRGWKAYFPEALIYGGDIDKRILFSEERIQTYFIDQLVPDTLEGLWRHIPHISFDIFIDDGLHELEAGMNTFKTSFDRVRPGGFYVIEDVLLNQLDRYVEFLEAAGIDAVAVELSHPFNTFDNCIIVAGRPKRALSP